MLCKFSISKLNETENQEEVLSRNPHWFSMSVASKASLLLCTQTCVASAFGLQGTKWLSYQAGITLYPLSSYDVLLQSVISFMKSSFKPAGCALDNASAYFILLISQFHVYTEAL